MSTSVESKINKLLTSDENNKCEFKLKYKFDKTSQKRNFVKDVCAMANYLFINGGNGYILIGIEDGTRKIVGINSDDYDEPKIQQIISSITDPPPNVKFEVIKYSNKNLGLITINKNYGGPHRIKNVGFPIRRGTTNDLMTTSEIYECMLRRDKYNKQQQDEYEIMSSRQKNKKVTKDIIDILTELEFIKINMDEYKGGYGFRYYNPSKYIHSIKKIKEMDYIFYINVNEKGRKNDLFRINYSLEGYMNEKKIENVVIIYVFTSKIGTGFYNDLMDSNKDLTKINISPYVYYFGLGKGFRKSKNHNLVYHYPKFYISNTKSKEDIKIKLEAVLKWINNNTDLVNEINRYFVNILNHTGV